MGTTCTAAYVGESDVTIAHVGDSRAYLWRDGELTRLTRDHSLVGELVARGKLTEEQAEAHPQRSVITRALGPEREVQVDVEAFAARGGDVYLLCSDGLTSMIHEPGVRPVLERMTELERTGRELIAAANEAGGRDNITVILFRLEEVDGAAAAAARRRRRPHRADDRQTGEYDTFEGEAVAPRQGASRPTRTRGCATRRRCTRARSRTPCAPPTSTEAEYRAQRHRRAVGDQAARAAPSRRGAPKRTAPLPDGTPPSGDRKPSGKKRRRRIPAGVVDRRRPARDGPAARSGSRRQAVYFVGTDADRGDTVTIYRGLPVDLPLGVELYTRYQGSGVTLRAVPAGAPQDVHGSQAALEGRRGEPRDPARTRADRLVSARNRELLALVPASLLLTAGFAAIFIQQSEELSDVSLTYGAIFLLLCLAGHFVIRFTLPLRGPVPVPARQRARVLRPGRHLPDRRGAGARAGAVVRGRAGPVRGDDPAAARLPRARALPLHDRAGRPAAAAAAARAGDRPAGQRRLPGRQARARSPSSRRSSARSRSSSSWPRTCATRGRCSSRARTHPGVTIPPLKHLGPLLVVWGAAMFMLVFIRDLGSSLMYFGGFLALLYVATNRLSFVVDRAGACSRVGAWFFASTVSHVQDRVDIWLDPFNPQWVEKEGYQIAQSVFAQADGGLFGTGFGASLLRGPSGETLIPAPHTDLIYAVIVNESGWSARAGCCSSTCC